MSYICQFCDKKFSTKRVEVICPVCGEDYFIEKSTKKQKKHKKDMKVKGNEK